tara:strand:- start:12915 stop:13877 length:963 start_codon:yes stop_codon:yes gene_type:complete
MVSNDSSQKNIGYDDEIDLKELFTVIWAHKKFIILLTACFAFTSVLYSLTLKNYYKSEAVLSVAGESGMRSSLAGLGSFATLAGINLPKSSAGDKSVVALETIRTRDFLRHLITIKNILPSIMAADSYDVQSKKIKFNPKIYNITNEKWVRKPPKNLEPKPSYLEAHKTYLNMISVEQDKANNLISISVEHLSPIFAKELLELIINEVNEIIRSKDLQASSDAIMFLNNEIPKATLITMKEAINMLVQSQLETQMLSKVSKEYVLKLVEPPFIPEEKSKPKRALIGILGALLGLMISLVWVLVRHYIFSNEDIQNAHKRD